MTQRVNNPEQNLDFEAIGAEWVRAVRGKRSQAAFSKRLGYASSVVHRWEQGSAWPTASRFLQACERNGKDVGAAYSAFFHRTPSWLQQHEATSPGAVAAFLRQLRGKTKIDALCELSGYSRYQIARWFKAETEPKLPEFLRLTEACSRRSLDFIATLTDPNTLPLRDEGAEAGVTAVIVYPMNALAEDQLQRMREAAYEDSWSHAVLRALELEEYVEVDDVELWLTAVVGIPLEQVRRALHVLEQSGQITRDGTRWSRLPTTSVTTGGDPAMRGLLTQAWTKVAYERMRRKAPGHFGYSLFSVSRADLRRIRELQVAYLREMQSIIAQSAPNECVGLLCLQLMDLSERPSNALLED